MINDDNKSITVVVLIISFLFIVLTKDARCEHWVLYHEKDGMQWLYDKDSINRPKQYVVRLWTRQIFNEQLTAIIGKCATDLLEEINCKEQTFDMFLAKDYNCDWKVTGSNSYPNPQLFPIEPNSPSGILMRKVCKFK